MDCISVIIPIYNSKNILERAINSIYKQGIDNFKIILVDDGSNDGSAKICDEWSQKDKRIKVIHIEKNKGVSNARNIGLDNVILDGYVFFLDSDDEIKENAFSLFLKESQGKGADIIIGGYVSIDMITSETKEHATEDNYCGIYDKDKIKKFFIEDAFTNEGSHISKNLCSCLYSVKFLQKNNLKFHVKQKFGEDARFMTETYSAAEKILVTNILSYVYYKNLNEVSNKYYNQYYYSTIVTYKYCSVILKKMRLNRQCGYHLTGGTYVGINSYMICAHNRGAKRIKICSFIYNPVIIKVLFKVIFMKKKNMVYADISGKDKLVAILYLLGFYKKALKIYSR